MSTVIGMIIAALPGVKHGALHYRTLESEKTAALRHNGDDYNGCMTLSPLATVEIQWWHTNVSTSHHFIHTPPLDTTIYSDASLDGWGATNTLTTVGAPWENMDDLPHINVLESYAAKLALTHLVANCPGSHMHLKLDNFTAVSHINRMGGTHSQTCNHVTQDIWAWAISHNIWLSAAYISGDTNVVADLHSRCFTENTEWARNTDVFLLLPNVFFRPEIDLFASALNHQIPLPYLTHIHFLVTRSKCVCG